MMTKSELIEVIASERGLPQKYVEAVVNTVIESIIDAMQRDERVEIRGFGNFTMRHYDSYTGRNPKTGDRVPVGPKRMPFFKVGKDLRDRVDNHR
jgi:integration host factor subunit beta